MQFSDEISYSPVRSTYVVLFATSCRDPADHTPAPPDRRTPSNCANLQAPGDTWVQLRTASLVEPAHHVSVRPSPVHCCILLFEGALSTVSPKSDFPSKSSESVSEVGISGALTILSSERTVPFIKKLYWQY